MPGTSNISRLVTIRVSNKAFNEYDRLVKTSPRNPHASPEQMIKWVIEWYPFRHTTRKFKKSLT